MMCHYPPSPLSQAQPAAESSGAKAKATPHPAKRWERTTEPVGQDAVFGGH